MPATDSGIHVTRPRNRIADSLPTTAAFHKPEAAVNAIDGRPTAFVPAEDDDDESITPRLPTQVEGETGQAFPLDKVGEKCYAGVKQYTTHGGARAVPRGATLRVG